MLERMGVDRDVPLLRQRLERADMVEVPVRHHDCLRLRARPVELFAGPPDQRRGRDEPGVDQGEGLPVPDKADIDDGEPPIGDIRRCAVNGVVVDAHETLGDFDLGGHRLGLLEFHGRSFGTGLAFPRDLAPAAARRPAALAVGNCRRSCPRFAHPAFRGAGRPGSARAFVAKLELFRRRRRRPIFPLEPREGGQLSALRS